MSLIKIANLGSENLMINLNAEEVQHVKGGLETTIIHIDAQGKYLKHEVINDGHPYDVKVVVDR